jgi:hypothetical protein
MTKSDGRQQLNNQRTNDGATAAAAAAAAAAARKVMGLSGDAGSSSPLI